MQLQCLGAESSGQRDLLLLAAQFNHFSLLSIFITGLGPGFPLALDLISVGRFVLV